MKWTGISIVVDCVRQPGCGHAPAALCSHSGPKWPESHRRAGVTWRKQTWWTAAMEVVRGVAVRYQTSQVLGVTRLYKLNFLGVIVTGLCYAIRSNCSLQQGWWAADRCLLIATSSTISPQAQPTITQKTSLEANYSLSYLYTFSHAVLLKATLHSFRLIKLKPEAGCWKRFQKTLNCKWY